MNRSYMPDSDLTYDLLMAMAKLSLKGKMVSYFQRYSGDEAVIPNKFSGYDSSFEDIWHQTLDCKSCPVTNFRKIEVT